MDMQVFGLLLRLRMPHARRAVGIRAASNFIIPILPNAFADIAKGPCLPVRVSVMGHQEVRVVAGEAPRGAARRDHLPAGPVHSFQRRQGSRLHLLHVLRCRRL